MSCYKVPLHQRDGSILSWTAVDEQDVEWVTQNRWSFAHGYAVRSQRPDGQFRLHRELLGLPQKGRVPEVDHLNGDKLDNRRVNLRVTTRQGNVQNTDHFTGVGLHRGRWRARVRHNKKEYFLGYFDTEREAREVAGAKRSEFVPEIERPDRIDIESLPVALTRSRKKG